MKKVRKGSKPPSTINTLEILKNAVSSIQLGVEDFEMSRDTPGKEVRAISAARNIYSGVLLLFKYKITSLGKTPEEAAALIYKPVKILPNVTESGDIAWKPTLHGRETIDTTMIKERLESLGIYHDWSVMTQLQNCRNALEHLHPTDPLSTIQASIAALFPMLRRFIIEELDEAPAALLGDAWSSMLATHEFYKANEARIAQEWTDISFPDPAMETLSETVCPECFYPLLQPSQADVNAGVSVNTTEFRYECLACHHSDSLMELLQSDFALAHENQFDGYEHVVECNACYVHMFLIDDDCCHWCGAEQRWPRCSGCDSPLREDARISGGSLCDRCSEDEWMFNNR